jgi:two-component system cell cycle sensor histidine kinase/response regulator CckA
METINGKYRLLIIDDNPTIHEDIKKILNPAREDNDLLDLAEELFGSQTKGIAHSQFQIDSAFQGQEGLAMVENAILESNPYTLAFVDVRMPPGWDGIETVRRIWDKYPELQVVICTAYSDHSWDDIIQQLGHSDSLVILKKPFDNVEVLQLAHALSKKWTLSRQAKIHLEDLDELVRIRTDALSKANEKLQAEVRQRASIEAALRSSEERFQKAFRAAAFPMAIVHRQTQTYLEVNDSFLTLAAKPREHFIGQPRTTLNLLMNQSDYEEIIRQLRSTGAVRDAKCRIRRDNDEPRDTLISLEPVVVGEEDCILVAVHDVTDQLQLEARLRQSQKMEAIGQLAAGVAHDFNNLLTIIHGHTSLQMSRADLDQQVAYSLNQVKMAADRAAALTKQLLAFSRKQVVKRKPLNLGEIIARVHPMLSRMIGETITLERSCPFDLPPVFADEHCLEQIVMNLVVNARDATPSGGKVRIYAEAVTLDVVVAKKNPEAKAGAFVRLSVEDNGCGIETTNLARLFEPFFTTKPKGKGTGLGLSTVYGIVRQHEGWIEVVSKRGIGSTFRVYLPISDKPAAIGGDTEITAKNYAKDQTVRTVLVVEDEDPLREFMSMTLEQHGFRVLQAGDGVEAQLVWQTSQQPIDLLVTDMVMPNGVSGGDLANRLLTKRSDLKILYTSGYSTEVLDNAELLIEGKNFLPKPFNVPKLIKAVRCCLEGDNSVGLNTANTVN